MIDKTLSNTWMAKTHKSP